MMFAYCNSLSIVPSIEQWDTSNVTTMQWMFYCASSFNQSIDSWDVSNVTDISFMFGFANAFNQNISDWNIANVTDMTQFLYSSSLSTTNYDALLIAWSNLPALQRNVSLNTLPAKYSSAASAARQKLITDYGWTITDGGLAP
jgi:surface protein